jgi:ceroid-lipofuscinosis MFS transporter 7
MVSVIRAYVATASTSRDRIKAISINTAFSAIGIAIGPGLQAAFTPLGYPGNFKLFRYKKQQLL